LGRGVIASQCPIARPKRRIPKTLNDILALHKNRKSKILLQKPIPK